MIKYYIILTIVTFTFFIAESKGDIRSIAATPYEIYEQTECNLFGSAILFILLAVLNPLFILCRFIYWIFHVGRNNDR